jgi:putative flippase GtrA
MKSFLLRFKELFWTRDFLLFIIIGIINTLDCILFSMIYLEFIKDTQISFIPGYITSLTVAYLLNSLIIFKEKLNLGKYIKFCISYIPNFIIQNIVVFAVYYIITVDLVIFLNINIRSLIAYSIAAVLGIPITFICVKIFAFGKKIEK